LVLSPTGSINLGFILREDLLLCSSYLPLGVPNWADIYTPSTARVKELTNKIRPFSLVEGVQRMTREISKVQSVFLARLCLRSTSAFIRRLGDQNMVLSSIYLNGRGGRYMVGKGKACQWRAKRS
jgi:hypothetical protein